jgi:hypothetical protein
MPHFLTSLVLLIALSGQSQAPVGSYKPVGYGGHFIGEPIKVFLRLEPDARSELEVCEQHPKQSICAKLFAAVEKDQRAEITTAVQPDMDNPDTSNDAYNFILDGGKLVKITVPINDLADTMKGFGEPTSDKVVPRHNSDGAKWEDHAYAWDLPGAYVTIYIDNNPVLQDHRPVLVIESREEHARVNSDSIKAVSAPN